MITDRDLKYLLHLRTYHFSIVPLLRDDVAPEDEDGSVTRGRMRVLEKAGLAKSFRAQVLNPLANSTAPVWTITEAGACLLATRMADMSLLLNHQINTHAWQNFGHWVSITALLMKFRKALAKQDQVEMSNLFFEHDIISTDSDPAKRFRLYTVTSEKPRRIVANPDFAFQIKLGNFRRAYYAEYETGSEESPARCAAKKSPGMFGMAQAALFNRHFPQAHDMVALAFCPNLAWLQSMKKAMADKPGAALWRFVAVDQITADNFLDGNLFYTCDAGPMPFVRPAGCPAGTPPGSPIPEIAAR